MGSQKCVCVCVGWDIHECESAIRYRELSWWFLQLIGLVHQWVTLLIYIVNNYNFCIIQWQLWMKNYIWTFCTIFFFFFESDILYNCTCIIQLLHSRFITENGKGTTIIGKFMDLRTRWTNWFFSIFSLKRKRI